MTLKTPRKPGQKVSINDYCGASLARTIADITQHQNNQTVVITTDTPSAIKLQREIGFFSGDAESVLVFPDWEILPYDNFSPHQDIVSERLQTLYELKLNRSSTVIIPITTLLSRLCPTSFVEQHSLLLKTGDIIDIDSFRQSLVHAAYRHVPQVMEHGEFAIRGSILDIFPMGSLEPYRLDLFDDEIDTIRAFDPETQRSHDTLGEIRLLPAREFPSDDEAIETFRKQWRAQFTQNIRDCDIYQQVSEGLFPAGIEFYLPLFFENSATFFEYLPSDTLLVTVGDLHKKCEDYWEELKSRYEQRRHDIQRPILEPKQLFLGTEDVFASLKAYPRLVVDEPPKDETQRFTTLPELEINHKAQQPLEKLLTFMTETPYAILFSVESAGRREALLDLLKRHGIKPKVLDTWSDFKVKSKELSIIVSPAEAGFIDQKEQFAFITENQLFGQHVVQTRRRKKSSAYHDNIVKNLAELKIGELIVHIDQGVGRYRGLQTLDLNGQTNEFVTIEYAGGDKLYVPVQSLHLISRFTAGPDAAVPLNKLGNEQWSKAKRKAAEKIRDVAAELLDVYAKRESKPGLRCQFDEDDYRKFAQGFPFEETDDQQEAINAVLEDLKSNKAMDRLVCGDVGFGKTEVAMRAAFAAVQSGHQVALLVPTTLLAQQHYETLCDRFADWPIRIAVLSRFTTSTQQKKDIEAIGEGKIDIVVGTHKLLQGTVKFSQLGLAIIDEEHRFGVRQKDSLKAIRANVNVLALTATPIPRTLNMSMAGMRDLSIIATPPAKRRSIKTFVRESNPNLLREAILREIMRGGQVYFLHNEVKTIEKTAEEVRALIPEARVAIAHGQMRERELERVMQEFYHQRYNVLVCTTIIETGIDIPTANTIVMDRADKLGLAQLHQLRGRVGRSHHQAYAYLLTPPPRQLTKDAQKRLEAIEAAEDLGAGFTLATHDLEIRGAGELLGDEQSGHIQAIGFSLYMDLLDRAVAALKAGKEPELDTTLQAGCEVDLKIPALLPEEYIPDVNIRLSLYKRIASAQNDAELQAIQVELIDRFGLLPKQAKYLLKVTELKMLAEPLGILKIDANDSVARITISESTPIEPLALIKLIQQQPETFKLDGADRLKYFSDMEDATTRLDNLEELLTQLHSLSVQNQKKRAG